MSTLRIFKLVRNKADIEENINRQSLPMVFDLDGTLTPSDTTVMMVKHMLLNPLALLNAPKIKQLGFDRLAIKNLLLTMATSERISQMVQFNNATVDLLQKFKTNGRDCWLVTGAPHELAHAIAIRLNSFDLVRGSKDENLTGSRKLNFLKGAAPSGFDYIGDSLVDLPVWSEARYGYVVGTTRFASKVGKTIGREPVPITLVSDVN